MIFGKDCLYFGFCKVQKLLLTQIPFNSGSNWKQYVKKHCDFLSKTYSKSDLVKTGKKYKPPKKETIDSHMEEILHFLKYNGQKEKAYVLEAVYNGSADLPVKLKKVIDEVPDKSRQMSPLDATALILRSDLKKEQYEDIKKQTDALGHYFLPNYNVIVDEKKKLLPENIFVSEEKASVPLKDMMTKTVDRHLEDQEFVTFTNRIAKKNNGKTKLVVSYKTGFDVASGQRRFQVSVKTFQIQFWHYQI